MKKKDIKLSEDYHLCEQTSCCNTASEKHHLLSESKQNRRLYGDLINHDKNIQFLCYNCHHCKPLDKLTEVEFCQAIGIASRSKSAKSKKGFNPASGRIIDNKGGLIG